MENKDEKKKLKLLNGLISSIEGELESAKKILAEILSSENISETFKIDLNENFENSSSSGAFSNNSVDENSIFGIFVGNSIKAENGQTYPVNANYASKSRLVYGDKLKLIVKSDGKMVFKPVNLVERKWVIGELIQENGEYKVICENSVFDVLFASVTFYKAKPGDKLSIILPKDGKSPFATIDSILPNT